MEKTQKSTLYLGVDPKHFKTDKPLIHLPLIRISPRPIDSFEVRHTFSHIDAFTHLIFTSKSAVKIFCDYYKDLGKSLEELKNKYLIAIGHLAAYGLKEEGISPTYIAADETIEGIIRTLASLEQEKSHVLIPRSSSSYPQLAHFLVEHNIRHHVCILYDTFEEKPEQIPSLDHIDEVIFTSSVTVDAFFSLYEKVPEEIRLRPLGMCSREALRRHLSFDRQLTAVH